MIIDIFQEIRERNAFVSEVHGHVFDVLKALQTHARLQGKKVVVAAGVPDVTGVYLELSERNTEGKSSTVNVKLTTSGDLWILKEFPPEFKPESYKEECRTFDLSKAPISAAVDVLLIMAENHEGYVGRTLANFLEHSALGDFSHSASPNAPEL